MRARQAGSSPLALAVVSGDAACARALLARGAHVNARDRDGWTPLMWAAARGDAACMRLLLDAGANAFATDKVRGQAAGPCNARAHAQPPARFAVAC